MKKYILIAILSLSAGSMSACSVWDFVKPSSGIAVETEIVAGDKNQSVEVGSTSNTNKAEAIEITNNNVDYVVLGAFAASLITGVVGWMLPVPSFMRRFY